MPPTTTTAHPTVLGRRERARVRRWLWRFSLAMQDHPAREARRIRRDLGAALLDDAGRIGVDAALREIGSPWRVAADHLDALDSARPRWNDGAVLATLLGFGLPLYMWAAWAVGAVEAVGAMGGGRAELSWLGVPMTAENSDATYGLTFPLGWQPFAVSLALGALGFALGARVWRVWRRTPVS
ncbi:hypothetical protein H9657_08750 [Cellulomonas sp. Sa3CUA2]|uniref:DUF1700 domain-containing protein n=1 Tax=Cellulomonas avistercoris TaxID=2762242 RepID=A0ABR8QD51_9CELL|nr:hypothetical protein [Cellulomonas avistercoris]MBD7918363.1 hypothetical protein [Cellulomonas avistercoris]